MRSFLGIDVGTSGLKAALVGADGRLLAESEQSYPVATPVPGHAEADPQDWITATLSATGTLADQLVRTDVAAIGVVGQMHGAVPCSESGEPVGPAILWPDRRAETELDRWLSLTDRQQATLANPLVPGMTGPIVAWLARHRPDVIARAAAVLHAKDVVRLALTDRPAEPRLLTDRSDASATLLWNVPADRWADDVAAAVGVPGRLLPPVVTNYREVGRTDWLERVAPGAAADVAVATGAGDTPAALLAVGARGVHINFGTGAQVLVRLPAPANPDADPATHLYADAGDGWYAMTALQNGGLALDRAADLLGLRQDELFTAAARGRAGNVSFLPFFSGERGGVASPASRGGWLGAGTETTSDDLARAAVEGVLFAIRRAAELLGPAAIAEPEVTLSGGGWRTPLLVRLIADILGRPVRRIGLRSASAVGGAMLAARCVDTDLEVERLLAAATEPEDSPEIEAAYQRWLERCPAAETAT